ncbi:MAG TPA: cyclodeaminase/cyclohydrolase family protein [Candidatus Dormibacteraeota bacterium]
MLESIASKEPAPASGSAAAAVVAAAAALVEKCARLSARHWSGALAARDRAHALRLHAEDLVERDVHAYLAFVEAKRAGLGVERAQAATIEVPLEIVRTAVLVGELAELLAVVGNPNLRADAVAGAILAGAAAETAAMLVRVNVESDPDDPRARRARRQARGASARARRLDAPGRPGGHDRAPGRSAGTGQR